eukprot:TRINITY_DN315_c0_g1_i3.p1 TRINITY_DN315_c0_g1~~TRINITY_DN315_c0_g1_i3.p1  ORF type:complete len:247 (-),score=61.91 TRINITY_DN315_c0_g1_i3:476-1216(-)
MNRTLLISAVLACMCVATLAVPVRVMGFGNEDRVEPRHVLTTSRPLPSLWKRQERVPGHVNLRFTVAVTNTNLEVLERTFWEVSDPENAKYGQHMSKAQVDQLTAPRVESISAVKAWIKASNGRIVSEVSQGAFIIFEAPAQSAERMLWTQFFWHQHSSTQQRLVRAHNELPYSVPRSLSAHIDFVGGVSGFPTPRVSPSLSLSVSLSLSLSLSLSYLSYVYLLTATPTPLSLYPFTHAPTVCPTC